jgi:hypothetical protein
VKREKKMGEIREREKEGIVNFREVEIFQLVVLSWTFSTRDSTISQQLRVVEVRK